jgi:Phytanoyl-CoA dioxygenase (PhyH)
MIEVLDLPAYESLPIGAISNHMRLLVKKFDLERNIEEINERGFTVLTDVAPPEFFERLRAACLRCCEIDKGNYFQIMEKGASADLLLGRDPVFAEAAMNPKVLAMMEYMCGRNPLISQLACGVRYQGAKAMRLHCDLDWMPAPLPERHANTTACWYCQEMTLEAGATKVIPGSHLRRRHPRPEEEEAEEGAIPLIAPNYSVGVWDPRLWHSNYGRTLPGDRVVMHATYCRHMYRQLEDFSYLGQEFAEEWGPVMESLLGRNLWYGNRLTGTGGVDMTKYKWTWMAARR